MGITDAWNQLFELDQQKFHEFGEDDPSPHNEQLYF